MKKEFTPISMRCSQEQFDKIKHKLSEFKIEISSFGEMPYLTNFLFGIENNIANIFESCKDHYDREVYETWNEKVFLEACGIETEPEYVITKFEMDQLRYLLADDSHSGHHLRIEITKNILPNLFKEDKVDLEVGKWYKKGNTLALIKCIDDKGMYFQRFHYYGFNTSNGYENDCFDVMHGKDHGFELATPEEVLEYLTKEAVKRRYKKGIYVDRPDSFCNYGLKQIPISGNGFDLFGENNAKLQLNGVCIFENGIWAEIIPTITKEDAEKELNKKII